MLHKVTNQFERLILSAIFNLRIDKYLLVPGNLCFHCLKQHSIEEKRTKIVSESFESLSISTDFPFPAGKKKSPANVLVGIQIDGIWYVWRQTNENLSIFVCFSSKFSKWVFCAQISSKAPGPIQRKGDRISFGIQILRIKWITKPNIICFTFGCATRRTVYAVWPSPLPPNAMWSISFIAISLSLTHSLVESNRTDSGYT